MAFCFEKKRKERVLSSGGGGGVDDGVGYFCVFRAVYCASAVAGRFFACLLCCFLQGTPAAVRHDDKHSSPKNSC